MNQDLSAHNFRIECLQYKLHSCTSVIRVAEMLPIADSVFQDTEQQQPDVTGKEHFPGHVPTAHTPAV